MKLTRASSEPTIAAVAPYALKAGTKGATLTVYGDAFPATLTPSDIGLGKGLTVIRVVSVSPSQAVLTVDVAPDATVGAHDVGLGGSVLAGGLPVYKKVDYIKVTPDTALARLGGLDPGQLPQSMAAMGIAGGIGQLFSTHPPIEERIEALKNS